MAEISVYRAKVNSGTALEGEVYSFQPIPDQNYSRSMVPLGAGSPHGLEMKGSVEIRITVPDELYAEHGPQGTPAVQHSKDSSADHYTAFGLVQQVARRAPGFLIVTPSADT